MAESMAPTPPSQDGFRRATPNDQAILKECEGFRILRHVYGEYNPALVLIVGLFIPCIGIPNGYFTLFRYRKVRAFNNAEIDEVKFGKVSAQRRGDVVFVQGIPVDAKPVDPKGEHTSG